MIQKRIQVLIANVPLERKNILLPDKIVRLTLTRAKLCETIAKQIGSNNKSDFYMAGVYSALNVFFDGTKNEIMEDFPFNEDIYEALIEKEKQIKEVLDLAEAVEQAKWGEIHSICQRLKIKERCLFKLYAESINWAAERLHSDQETLLEKNN